MQDHSAVKKRPIFSRIMRFLFFSLIIACLFLLSLLALLFYYEDEVKKLVIKELNKHLKAEVKVDPGNIDLTVIKTFPYCSMEFKEVLMLEALKKKKRDTLLYSEKLNLYFNIVDLWEGHYTIEKIKLRNSVIKLRIQANGENNYSFWETSSPEHTTGSDSLRFKLSSLIAKDTRILYEDLQSKWYYTARLPSLDLSGQFGSDDYNFRIKADNQVSRLSYGKASYLKNRHLVLDLHFFVRGDNYEIKQAEIYLNKVRFALNGKFNYGDHLNTAHFELSAPDLDLERTLSLLPKALDTRLNDYKASGLAQLKASYHYKGTSDYSLAADFGIRDGNLRYLPSSTEANGIRANGHVEMRPGHSLLKVEGLRLQLDQGFLQADLEYRDFADPLLDLKAKASIDLEKLQQFYPIDTLNSLSGQLQLDLQYQGKTSILSKNPFGKETKIELEAVAKDLIIQFKHDEKISKLPACTLLVKNGEVELIDCRLVRGESDILLSGKAPGLFDHLNDKSNPLVLKGSLRSENLRLEDLMVKYYSSADKNAPLIPSNVFFELDADIRSLSYATFHAKEISGNVEVRHQKAMTSDLKMKVMEGEAEIEAYFDNSKKALSVMVQSRFTHINITELFKQFNNFGQSTLMDKDLKGFANATLNLSGNWNNALESDLSSIRSDCDLLIEKGELLGFEPLMALSRFVDVKDLQHIKFSTLQSQIQIHDQKIFFPKTQVRSNALNLEFWGNHSFDNEIEYHFQLLISELLAKRRKNQDNEFGEVANDPENRRSAFVLMTGTVDKPIIKYDKRGLKEKIKADLQKEKQNLRTLLKEEFGLFKKDSALTPQKAKETRFELEKPGKAPAKKPLQHKKKESEEDDF